MGSLRQTWSRIRALFERGKLEREMAEEMRLHLEMRAERHVAAGLSPEEAHLEARRGFGGVAQLQERVRDERTLVWIEQVGQDLRYALRSLRQAPGFTAVAVLTLALGIGVNATMFSIVCDHYLRPLWRDESLRLATLYTRLESTGSSYRHFNYTEYEAIRAERAIFADVAAMGFATVAVGDDTDTKRSLVSLVSANYFSLLAVRPAAGRFFTAEEAEPNANLPVAVASHPYWVRLGRPANLVGSIIRINNLDFTVVGVAPEGFGGLHNAISPELWLPLGIASQLAGFYGSGDTSDLRHSRSFRLGLIASLAPAVDLAVAQSRLPALDARLNEGVPVAERRQLLATRPSRYNFANTAPDHPVMEEFSRRSTAIALALASAVLLVACLNVANLLLARGMTRQKEFAVRLALGASRGRVVRQLLTEALVLGGTAAVLGIVFCSWLNATLQQPMIEAMGTSAYAFNRRPPLDSWVLTFTLMISLGATFAFSLVPALRATRMDLVTDLKRSAEGDAARGGWDRFFGLRNCLVMGQIALALALLFGAGLFLRAVQAASNLDQGFRTESRWVANLDFDFGQTPRADIARHQQAILERVRELPGVRRAALASAVPYNFERHTRGVFVVGAGEGEARDSQTGVYTAVSPGYFDAMGITLLRGRDFNASDVAVGAGGRPVAVIDETLARRLFGDSEPLGRFIATNKADAIGTNPNGAIEVVGIVRSPREEVFEEDAPARFYRPFAQSGATNTYVHVELVSGVPFADFAIRLRRELATLEPDNPVLLLRPLEDFPRRNINTVSIAFGAVLAAGCAGVAFVLAVVGVYSVKAYAVARRTREIGIRMALGARPAEVYRLVLAQGAWQAAAGIGAGSVLAFFTGQAAAQLLYRVSPNDWALLAFVGGVLAAATLLACLLPARRAARVDPLKALRCE